MTSDTLFNRTLNQWAADRNAAKERVRDLLSSPRNGMSHDQIDQVMGIIGDACYHAMRYGELKERQRIYQILRSTQVT